MTRLFLLIPALGLIYYYLGSRLAIGIGWPVWLGLGVACALVLSFPLSWFFRGDRKRGEDFWLKAFLWAVYLDMGFLSFLSTLTILRDLLGLPLGLLFPEWSDLIFSRESTLVLLLLTVAINIFGFWSATRGPMVRRVEVPIDNLPPGLVGYKIAQISDLHIGTTIGRRYVDGVVKIVNDLLPNMTVLTGDIGDGEVSEPLMQDALAGFLHLGEAQEKFFVTGNHEYYWNAPKWIEAIEKLGIRALINSRHIVDHQGEQILVGGAVDLAARLLNPPMQPDLQAARGEPHQAAVKILLLHNPSLAHHAARLGFDLQISGHTHAGQFFPWTLVVKRVHEFSQGLKACGKMWVYVNSGTGSWGPPLRVGSQTEVTLLTLVAR